MICRPVTEATEGRDGRSRDNHHMYRMGQKWKRSKENRNGEISVKRKKNYRIEGKADLEVLAETKPGNKRHAEN